MIRAIAAVLAVLAAVLGLQMFFMIAFTAVLAVVLFLAWRIDLVTMSTGWGVIPVRRSRT